jgi:hypothetical protein
VLLPPRKVTLRLGFDNGLLSQPKKTGRHHAPNPSPLIQARAAFTHPLVRFDLAGIIRLEALIIVKVLIFPLVLVILLLFGTTRSNSSNKGFRRSLLTCRSTPTASMNCGTSGKR